MVPLFSLHLLLLVMASSSAAACSQSQKLVFILAGQSNMSGRGGITNNRWDRRVPRESNPSPSILRLDACLRWVEAVEPLHADIDVTKTCGVGPGLPFANSVKSELGDDVVLGLVPCAVGGTRIAEWARGTKLYRDMVARAKAAAVDDGGGGGGERNKIGALLWYQGESDTVARADAEAYKGRFERLITDLREDLGEPQLPIIQVYV